MFHLEDECPLSQSPQIGASCRTSWTPRIVICGVRSLNPLKSGRPVGPKFEAGRHNDGGQYVSIPSNRGVLSDQCIKKRKEKNMIKGLNPLKSGRPVGLDCVEHFSQRRQSQSPQIGASCRTYFLEKWGGFAEVSQSPQIGASCRTYCLK